MNAQEIIEASNFDDKLSLFYPELASKKQAEFNLSMIARCPVKVFA